MSKLFQSSDMVLQKSQFINKFIVIKIQESHKLIKPEKEERKEWVGGER